MNPKRKIVGRYLVLCCLSLVAISAHSKVHLYGAPKPSLKDSKYSQIPLIRVRIQADVPMVSVSGMDMTRVLYHNNQSHTAYNGRKRLVFDCKQMGKQNLSKPVILASMFSSTGLIGIEKHKYRGHLHIFTANGSEYCDVINETPLETYISTLLAKEMNAAWPVEVLKAQAVAARSYAIHKMGLANKTEGLSSYHLESSERDQVSGQFFDATEKTLVASTETQGEILVTKAGEATPIFFHAKCGGKTILPEQVWGNVVPGYKSTNCTFCQNHGKGDWNKMIDWTRFKEFLSWYAKQKNKALTDSIAKLTLAEFKLAPDKVERQNIRMYLGDQAISVGKSMFRRYFGRVLFPSHHFSMRIDGMGQLGFSGNGLGHGVGMCQLGALDLAQKGWDYKRILDYYYPGHQIKKIY